MPLSYSFTICGCMLSCCRGKQAGTGQPRGGRSAARNPLQQGRCGTHRGQRLLRDALGGASLLQRQLQLCRHLRICPGVRAGVRTRDHSRQTSGRPGRHGPGTRVPRARRARKTLPTTRARARRRCADPMEARRVSRAGGGFSAREPSPVSLSNLLASTEAAERPPFLPPPCFAVVSITPPVRCASLRVCCFW